MKCQKNFAEGQFYPPPYEMGTIGGHPVRFLYLNKGRIIGNLGEGAGGKPSTKGGRLRLGM